MTAPLKTTKQTVQLRPGPRPSRIRREPTKIVTAQQLARDAWWESREWEVRLAVVGITFFAVAISALVIDIGHIVGW
jgi:hypothetical protein